MTAEQPMTLEWFLGLPEQKPALEFFVGTVTQKVAPDLWHGLVQGQVASQANSPLLPHKRGVAAPEVRVTIGGASRVPDVVMFRWNRIPRDQDGELLDDVTTPPDVIVEVLSPGQTQRVELNRCHWFVSQGVQAALLVLRRMEERSMGSLGRPAPRQREARRCRQPRWLSAPLPANGAPTPHATHLPAVERQNQMASHPARSPISRRDRPVASGRQPTRPGGPRPAPNPRRREA